VAETHIATERFDNLADVLRVRPEKRGDAVVVHVAGELDLASAPVLDELLVEAEAGDVSLVPLVLDLTGVTFMASAGLALPPSSRYSGGLRAVWAQPRPLDPPLVPLLGQAEDGEVGDLVPAAGVGDENTGRVGGERGRAGVGDGPQDGQTVMARREPRGDGGDGLAGSVAVAVLLGTPVSIRSASTFLPGCGRAQSWKESARSCRVSTARATSSRGWPVLNACARSRRNASSRPIRSSVASMPVATLTSS
jgi:hypothetical protein